ncbi:hypothetical protein ACP70R_025279 [Stipagrostis hirtigluma subsp. patula]
MPITNSRRCEDDYVTFAINAPSRFKSSRSAAAMSPGCGRRFEPEPPLGLGSLLLSAAGAAAGTVVRSRELEAMDAACHSSGIEAEAPGLQGVVSWRGFGSIFSGGGGGAEGRVVHRMEFKAKDAACHFAMVRADLQVWVKHFEELEKKCGRKAYEIPAWVIVRHHDLFERVWGWERLFPVHDLRYLEEYYRKNGSPDAIAARFSIFTLVYPGRNKKDPSATHSDPAATGRRQANSTNGDDNLGCSKKDPNDTQSDAAATGRREANSTNGDENLVLVYEKEDELVDEWMKQGVCPTSDKIRLSSRIQKKIIRFVLRKKGRAVTPAVIHDCIKCILKEAELILERMRNGFDAYHRYNSLSNDIRKQVFCLMKKYLRADPCYACVATRAVLWGTAKEADLIREKLRREGWISIDEEGMSEAIRLFSLDILCSGLDETLLKSARTAGFRYWDVVEPAVAHVAAWREMDFGYNDNEETDLEKVQVSGSYELKNNSIAVYINEDDDVQGSRKDMHYREDRRWHGYLGSIL